MLYPQIPFDNIKDPKPIIRLLLLLLAIIFLFLFVLVTIKNIWINYNKGNKRNKKNKKNNNIVDLNSKDDEQECIQD